MLLKTIDYESSEMDEDMNYKNTQVYMLIRQFH